MNGRRILVFTRDPGGTNAVFPLIEPLRAKGNKLLVFGKDAALSIYQRHGIDHTNIGEVIPSDSLGGVGGFLRRTKPDLILTGTSSEDFTERRLWLSAEELGIPTFAVLDQWTNYLLRLAPEGNDCAEGFAAAGKLIFPSALFVMDDFAKQELSALGINEERLIVSGQPFFDYIRKTGNRFSSEEIDRTRRALAGKKGDRILVFASQPITSLHRQNGRAEDYWGYTEKTILKKIVTCLEAILLDRKIDLTLVIRLHPKEEQDAYHEMLTRRDRLRMLLDRETDSTLLLKAAEGVMGMFSMMLLEAALLETPFLSVQIGLNKENPFILDRIGMARSILREEDLAEGLHELLEGVVPRKVSSSLSCGATEKIVAYLESLK